MKELSLSFPCGDLVLEGRLALPATSARAAAAVLCHAHPLYGGSMDSNVLDAIVSALGQLSIAALKFNFRGVGGSQGSFGGGIEEQKDLDAALEYAASRPEIDATRIGAAGYSFGASVVLPVARRDVRIRAMALVSPAVAPADLSKLEGWERPALVISGDMDDFVSANELRALRGRISGGPQIEVISGADHFWWGREGPIAEKTAAFFAAHL